MMEDCATSMSAPQGCTDDMAVVESFKEALKGRVGADRYRMWFTHGVGFALQSKFASLDRNMIGGVGAESGAITETVCGDRSSVQPMLIVSVRGQFALDRLKKNFLSEIRGAAMQACGSRMDVQICLDEPTAQQAPLPLIDSAEESDLDQAAGAGEEPNIKPDRTPIDFGFAQFTASWFTASWFTARNSIEAARFDQSRVAIARRGKWQVAWQPRPLVVTNVLAAVVARDGFPTTCFARKRRIAR